MILLVAAASGAAETYRNLQYGLSFPIPAGADVCRSPPPLPDHGLLFRPAGVTTPPCDDDIEDGDRYIAVDARSIMDPSVAVGDFVADECPQLAYGQARVAAVPPAGRPGGLPWVACRIEGDDGMIEEVLFARRQRDGSPPIEYRLTFRTTRTDYDRDHLAFRRWLALVKLQPPS